MKTVKDTKKILYFSFWTAYTTYTDHICTIHHKQIKIHCGSRSWTITAHAVRTVKMQYCHTIIFSTAPLVLTCIYGDNFYINGNADWICLQNYYLQYQTCDSMEFSG